MKRVLKNSIRQHVDTSFRGRDIRFKSKASKIFDMDNEEQAAEWKHWKETFEFIYDITDKMEVSKL